MNTIRTSVPTGDPVGSTIRLPQDYGKADTRVPPKFCVRCDRWFYPAIGMEYTMCCVVHGPGSCCHYNQVEDASPYKLDL